MKHSAAGVSIKTRFLLIMLAFLTGMVLIAIYTLQSEKSTLLEDRKVKTRHLVESTYSLLGHYYGLQQKGVLTEEAAKNAALMAIKEMRYEQVEYFWVNDFTTPIPKMLMHPTVPALDGKVLDAEKFNCATSMQAGLDGRIEKTDGKKNLFVAFNEVANKGGQGYVTYNWPKPKAGGGTTDELYTKLSFVKKFEGWNWLLGSGIYLDDVDTIFWNHAAWLIGIIVTITALIGAVLLMVTRSITRQIGGEPDYAADFVRQVADGDLTVQVQVRSGDTTSLLASLRGMVNRLSELVGDVRGTTESITAASQEIAQGNADLSQRTEEQASSLEETASSMEELTSTVKQNAENAKQANQLAANASDFAVKGGKVVGDVVHTMASISDSSNKIVDIISVIEGIAFQTNILALNAAVEAARAGEQGRGFAVVAGEVRNLAQRSASAAKEIKALIDDSVGKVEVGSKQVNQAGATMTEIVQAVKRVTDIMAEIAAASNEQSAGIEQVNQAITQMDDVTQQNAALVEEAAAAAEAMQEQASVLMEAVSAFKLEAGRAMSGPSAGKQTAVHHHAPAVPARNARTLAKPKEGKDGDWKEF